MIAIVVALVISHHWAAANVAGSTNTSAPGATHLPATAPHTIVEPTYDDKDKPIRVLVNTMHPFAFQLDDGTFDGFSIDLFDSIAKENGWSYTFKRAESIVSLLDDLKTGKADLAFGGLTITSLRQRNLKFSFPTFETGLVIMVMKQDSWGLTHAIFSHQIWTAFCILVLSLIGAGHAIYFFEKDHNYGFRNGYFRSITRAVWWAGVTITTVGYGDIVPVTQKGRLFSLAWMFFGMVSVGFFSGSISAQLTVSNLNRGISGPDDLPGRIVATTYNSTSYTYLQRNGITTRAVHDISTAYDLLEDGEVEAVLYDGPTLLYYVVRDGLKRGFRLVLPSFETQQYGMLCSSIALADSIDIPLLKLREDYRYSALRSHWFGESEDLYHNANYNELVDHTFNWMLYGVTFALIFGSLSLYYLKRFKLLDERWIGVSMEQALKDATDDELENDMHNVLFNRHRTGNMMQPLSPNTRQFDDVARRLLVLEEKLELILDRLK